MIHKYQWKETLKVNSKLLTPSSALKNGSENKQILVTRSPLLELFYLMLQKQDGFRYLGVDWYLQSIANYVTKLCALRANDRNWWLEDQHASWIHFLLQCSHLNASKISQKHLKLAKWSRTVEAKKFAPRETSKLFSFFKSSVLLSFSTFSFQHFQLHLNFPPRHFLFALFTRQAKDGEVKDNLKTQLFHEIFFQVFFFQMQRRKGAAEKSQNCCIEIFLRFFSPTRSFSSNSEF